ncbi:hypothetical protein DRE_00739 [Drechslerella stenobrocha 248]|uniref:Postreplication repair E3 ubiquitin-protein ligase RAD18 n=1 Tax=Drechslerella stenobrocha 248 TaxID=1043628 RepID=W7I8I3_9PEZI|nr:hypothetical protein DRE_00739 [Drechslerella stenobrocha 248]
MDIDIPDPTDWLKTSIPNLQALDTSLGCGVCKEYFTAPMLTSCGHTFCSLCIRRHLSSVQKCPTCRQPDEENKLRKNTIIEELISAFLNVRKEMLERLAPKIEDESTSRRDSDIDMTRAEKRGSPGADDGAEDPDTMDRRRGKRRKREEPPNGASQESSTDRLRRSTRSSSQRTNSRLSNQAHDQIVDASDGDDDFTPLDDASDYESDSNRGKRRKQAARTPDAEDKVVCPLCFKPQDRSTVDVHVNQCIDLASRASVSPQKKPPPLGFRGPAPSGASNRQRPPYTDEEKAQLRIPKGNLSLTKEADIRKKLKGYGIRYDVSGKESKQVLWARLQDFINLWNANLDSLTPKLQRELVRDLDARERSQMNQKPSVVQDKEFERDVWSKKYGTSFASLTANARQSSTKKENVSTSAGGSSAAATSQAPEPTMMTAEVNGIGSP